jgi:hypothetical protein
MTTDARDRRADNRRRRRVEDDAQPQDGGASTPGHLQDALKGVASAAAVGAAVGAARAYSARRRDDDDEREEQGQEQAAEPEAVHDEPDPPREDRPVDQPPPPVDRGDLHDAVAQARRLLEDLRGAEPESVSSVAATRDGWLVGLEVVEVHRIPDSTDVLATYEVEVGGDGAVRRFERTRRYHRSEADRGGR